MPMLLAAACGSPSSSPQTGQLPPTAGLPPTSAPPQSKTSAPPTSAPPQSKTSAPPTSAPLQSKAAPPPTSALPPTVAPAAVTALQTTPECADDDDPTPSQSEGPYFHRHS